MATETVQLQLIRRYARLLREQQARARGPKIGARERRLKQEAVAAGETRRDSSTPPAAAVS
jgi:hypothetical protein